MRSRMSVWMLCCALAPACASIADAPTRGEGEFEREVRGGQLHRGPAIDLTGLTGVSIDPAVLGGVLARADLVPAVGSLETGDFVRVAGATTATAGGARLVHLTLGQQIDGIPVHGTYLDLTFRDADGGALVASAYHLFHEARVDTTVRIDRRAAVVAARTALRVGGDAPAREPALEIWPLDRGLTLVWVVDVEGADRRALVRANGPRAGEVSLHDERVFDADGVLTGQVAVGGAPGGKGQPQQLPLASTRIAAGAAETYTDGAGGFAIASAPGDTVTARFFGHAADVRSYGGGDATASAPAGSGLALVIGGTTEALLAQGTAYHAVTATRAFLVGEGFPEADFGAPLVTNVNLADTCNAYFHPTQRTINFFRAGGGCRNSAEASIVAHEYGHFVDDFYGGITNGGLSEGWGDALACLSLADPVVGGDLLPDGEIIRTCDNDYAFPASGYDEVHALGQAWAGFVWHAREALIAELGAADGDALIRDLVLPSLPSNAADIPAAVREVFLRDDDDGDLGNHSPHWDVLLAAAQRHGLGFVVDGDLKAPAAVTDLSATAAGPSTVVLHWTAPGDDGAEGTAAAYDLRIASAPITEATWSAATPVPAPDPVPAGGAQQATITIPPGATVHVALRAVDEAGNQSSLSNVATATPAPVRVVFADGAEDGLGAWKATGLWHVTARRAATGTHAFWFGNEASGTYGPGRTMGVVDSPVIDLADADAPALVWSEYVHVEDDPYDRTTITVWDIDDPMAKVTAGKLGGWTDGTFRTRVLDLAPLAGRRVVVELGFDTVDGAYNETEGWFVDDVRVIAAETSMPLPAPALVINEVLADPPPGWDSGGDGVASTTADEMIELVNPGSGALDLSGWTIADAVRTRVTMPQGTVIAPGAALVVLGGGASTLDVPVVTAPGLYLNNDGDAVRVRTPDGAIAAEVTWGAEGGRDSALVRQVDGDAASPLVRHVELNGRVATPGTRADGSPWASSAASHVVINEILADPPAGYDASADGVASATGDELIEIVNVGSAAVDVSGATVSDAISVRATMPDGVMIAPGDVLVVFGGAVGLSLPGVTVVPSSGLGLNNDGDRLTFAAPGGAVLATAIYGAIGGHDQSIVRAVEGDDTSTWVLHGSVASTPASPGLRADGEPF